MKPPRIAVPEPTSRNFAYNQRAWPQFAHAIQSCGGVAVPIPLSESQASVAHTISGCSGILLPGSPADVNPQKYGQSPEPKCAPSDPDREAVDELLLQDALQPPQAHLRCLLRPAGPQCLVQRNPAATYPRRSA